MKHPFSVSSLRLLFLIGTMACTMDNSIVSSPPGGSNNGNSPNDTVGNRLKIRVGSTAFTTTLLNNATVTAFKDLLPMTVAMSELNGNEKLYRFANNLPTSALNPGTINTGDLMLYGANTLVLFYQTFPTSYAYTRLGRVDNPAGLAAVLGASSVIVSFEME